MARISTRFTEMLGIEHPIIQGGMGWVGAELPAAVSEAGGLGMICAGSHAQEGGLDGLRSLIRQCKKLTNKPFGVNFLLLSGGNDWLATAALIIEEGVRVVETAGRPPPQQLLSMFRDASVRVIHKCVTLRHALAAERAGVDVVEIAGFDLGGHPGEKDVGNWILLAKAGQVLSVPWIAAGGCATGTQLAAALSLGADGCNMGTRFLATQECKVGDAIKQCIVDGSEDDTELLMRGYNTLRVYKNSASNEAKSIELQDGKDASKNKRYRSLLQDNPEAMTRQALQGKIDQDAAVWSAGQAMGLINDVPSCSTLLVRLVSEAAKALHKSTATVTMPSSRL